MTMSVRIVAKEPGKSDIYCLHGHLQRKDATDRQVSWSVAGSCKQCGK